MDAQKISGAELGIALGRLNQMQERLAREKKAAKLRAIDANFEADEAERKLQVAKERIELLKRASILRLNQPTGEAAELRLQMSVLCQEAKQDKTTVGRRQEINLMLRTLRQKLQHACQHPLVFGYKGHDSIIDAYSTSGRLMCAHCGNNELTSDNFLHRTTDERRVLEHDNVDMDRLAKLVEAGDMNQMLEQAFELKKAFDTAQECAKDFD